MQNTTQAPALVRGNISKNEMYTGDCWPIVIQTIVFTLQQNECWPQLNEAKVSEVIVRSLSKTPWGHHRLEIWDLHSEKLSLIVDDLGILCTSTSDMTSMGPNVNNTTDAILRDTSDRPSVKARPLMPPMFGWSTDDSGAIVPIVEGTSCGEEVAAARRHVTERFAIEADPVPKEDKGQSCDKRQSRLEYHRYGGIQPRGGPQATDRETARTTRLKWYTRRTLELDTRRVDLRRITSYSFSFGTLLRTPMKQRSWAMKDSLNSTRLSDVGPFKGHQQEAQRVTTWSRARQHRITQLWSFDKDAVRLRAPLAMS